MLWESKLTENCCLFVPKVINKSSRRVKINYTRKILQKLWRGLGD